MTNPEPVAMRHFLQSDEWAAFQHALGHTVVKDSGDGWNYVAIVERGHGLAGTLGPRLYAPYGPTYTNNEALLAALNSLRAQAAQHRCFYLRVEPMATQAFADLDALGLKKAKRNTQPNLTHIADLRCSFDDVLLGCTKTNRYLWRRQADYHLDFETYYDLDHIEPFLAMMASTGSRSGATFHAEHYYRAMIESLGPHKAAGIIYAVHQDQPVAGMLFIDDHLAVTRYYMHAGSFESARKLNAMAIMLMWAMHDAKVQGIEYFDFFGVSPADQPSHRWAGFSTFKRSFGGNDVAYAGTYELAVNKNKYRILQGLRTLHH